MRIMSILCSTSSSVRAPGQTFPDTTCFQLQCVAYTNPMSSTYSEIPLLHWVVGGSYLMETC